MCRTNKGSTEGLWPTHKGTNSAFTLEQPPHPHSHFFFLDAACPHAWVTWAAVFRSSWQPHRSGWGGSCLLARDVPEPGCSSSCPRNSLIYALQRREKRPLLSSCARRCEDGGQAAADHCMQYERSCTAHGHACSMVWRYPLLVSWCPELQPCICTSPPSTSTTRSHFLRNL